MSGVALIGFITLLFLLFQGSTSQKLISKPGINYTFNVTLNTSTESIRIEIGGHTDDQGADDYNDRGDEHVKPEQHTFRVSNGTVTIPAHTLAFITIE